MPYVHHTNVRGKAVTEDDIKVLHLCAYRLPEHVTAIKVKEHFQKFGEILEVRLLGNSKNKKCFIYFAHPKAAAKALKNSVIHFMECYIRVEPCHSFRQPDGVKFINLFDRVCKSGPIERDQEALILTLNDDCLEKICKKLPVNDQINFALTCARFYNVMVMCSKVEHANLNTIIFAELSLYKTRIFLQIVGPQVKNLVSNRLSEYAIYKYLGLYCTNVEKLKLITCLNIEFVRKLTEKMHLLQELELSDVELTDKFVKYFKKFKNLKSLSIDNDIIKGDNIYLLNGLEKLSLAQSRFISSKSFKKICKNLTKLHYLDTRECIFLSKYDYEHMSQHLLQLEILKLSGNYEDFNCSAKLPKLKHLEIQGIGKHSIGENFFKNLATYQAHQMEVLKLDLYNNISWKMASLVAELRKLKLLDCNCKGLNDEMLFIFSQLTELEEIYLGDCSLITNQSVLQLLENCLKLKHLDLKCCYRLTPQLLANVLTLLENQRARSLRTVRVHMALSIGRMDDIMINAISAVDNFSNILKINVKYEADDDENYIYDSDAMNDPEVNAMYYNRRFFYPNTSSSDSDFDSDD